MRKRMATRLVLVVLLALDVAPLPSTAVCQQGTIIRRNQLTCKQIKDIVDKHNKLRQLVAQGGVEGQPEAVNMLQLSWDKELASEAQAWADRCVFEHPTNRTLERFRYGQNIAWSWWSGGPPPTGGAPQFGPTIQRWFDEVYQYGYQGTYKPETGHYSQIIWGSTYLVGCGYVYYKSDTKYNQFYVCNYGPGGNIIGSQPYAYGTPACTQSGTSPSKTFPGLCVVKKIKTNTCRVAIQGA